MRQLVEPAEDDWHGIAQDIMREAQEMYGRGNDIELTALAARVRGHFLDRWYRFTRHKILPHRGAQLGARWAALTGSAAPWSARKPTR